MTDTRTSAETLLADLETQLGRVDERLLAADPGALRSACSELRRAAIASARVVEAAFLARAVDPALRRRIEVVAQRLAGQRTNLARRSAIVEGALASLLGPQADATYSVLGERTAFGPANLQ